MIRLALSLFTAVIIGTNAHANSERTESLAWTAKCQFEEGTKISHGLRKDGTSLVLRKLGTKFSNTSTSISLTKVEYNSVDGTRKKIYFLKAKSPNDDDFLNMTIEGSNVKISPHQIEILSSIVNFTIRLNDENSKWYGTLVYFNSKPHIFPPAVNNEVHFAPVVCS